MTFNHPSHQPPPIDDLQPHQSPLSSSVRRPLATGLLHRKWVRLTGSKRGKKVIIHTHSEV
ncbi:hypothetical protein HanRHA438_Chr11g0486501 [Helianthus annuus]|nr:hypothetical protein HanRHA438_Chr11g0486501 [Helianthus annuus]